MLIKRNSKGQFTKGNVPFDRTGIKHTEKTKKKLKKARVGRKPNLGHHHSEETKAKMSKDRKGQVGYWMGRKRKPQSGEQKENSSISKRGNKNPAWIDGRSKITSQIRRSLKYRQWRESIFKRDNYTCQECKLRSKKGSALHIEAHHLKEFSKILTEYNIKTIEEAFTCDELWDINNGKTLCLECHNKTKTYANNRCRKSNK